MAETAEFNPMGMMMPMMVMMMMMGIMGNMFGGTSSDTSGGDDNGGYVPNPTGLYQCPYCSIAPFLTLEELQAHVVADHPGERVPTTVIFT